MKKQKIIFIAFTLLILVVLSSCYVKIDGAEYEDEPQITYGKRYVSEPSQKMTLVFYQDGTGEFCYNESNEEFKTDFVWEYMSANKGVYIFEIGENKYKESFSISSPIYFDKSFCAFAKGAYFSNYRFILEGSDLYKKVNAN